MPFWIMGFIVELWTIRGSLMRPKWSKLASLWHFQCIVVIAKMVFIYELVFILWSQIRLSVWSKFILTHASATLCKSARHVFLCFPHAKWQKILLLLIRGCIKIHLSTIAKIKIKWSEIRAHIFKTIHTSCYPLESQRIWFVCIQISAYTKI